MSHLNPETLARIVDGPATDTEVAHLDACAACRGELERMREEIAALGELPDPAPPPGLWDRIEAGLDEPVGRDRSTIPWIRAAAAIAVFAIGAASGWMLRGPATSRPPSPNVAEQTGSPFAEREAADPEGRLRRAEEAYARAVRDYLEAHPQADPVAVVPYERMAALQGIALTARAALEQAPEDPVIDRYYRTAVSQQQALMSNVAVPVSEDEPWF